MFLSEIYENCREEGRQEGIKIGIEQGIEQGIERGIEQGIEKEALRAVEAFVAANLVDAKKACEILGVSYDDYLAYKTKQDLPETVHDSDELGAYES